MNIYDDMRAALNAELASVFAQGSVSYRFHVYDDSTPWAPKQTQTITILVKAAVSGVSQRYVDGSTVLATDLQALVSTRSDAPYELSYLYEDGTGYSEWRTMTVTAAMVNNWYLYFFLPYSAAPPGMDPNISNLGEMIVDGKAHQIVRVDAIPAAGEPVAWRVFIRA